eukprot:210515-Pelagomonas_calceolata.AAC.1
MLQCPALSADFSFQFIEGVLLVCAPFPGSGVLKQIVQGVCNGTEVLHIAPIIIQQAEHTAQFRYTGGF